ncbi:MAG: hypothetical protein O7E56_14065 [SAR324 cluster bacterium]|nr:hypothetical protein [SAR324 cluster bacterium]MCZ6629343.1 hypothetical protein [SAR324 cluster bacterium]MCZ6647438.1 hypothetical protein [SAR324 cluster bacterium]MCZ6841607.1 hypothetical protein [SAR324 cluster bacterium]
MADDGSELALLKRRATQFLVHSFLYYRLGESVLSDEFFDQLAEELRVLRKKHPEADMPFPEIVDQALGEEASGFVIRNYPPQIISSAFKLLYAVSSPQVDFVEFVERRGYQARIQPEETG